MVDIIHIIQFKGLTGLKINGINSHNKRSENENNKVQ